MIKKLIKKTLKACGYEIRKSADADPLAPYGDLTAAEKKILCRSQPYSMTSSERMAALVHGIRYITSHKIPGSIVECGVWKGGSMMSAAMVLMSQGDQTRDLYLFDTFSGMSEPGHSDFDLAGQPAVALLSGEEPGQGIWCQADLEEVRRNLYSTGYPGERIHFIQGKVEDTLAANSPEKIALLRLDTDWYESTRQEFLHLYPRLSDWGLLIIDDYGHWQGARKATDEFLATLPYPLYLHRVDYTARMAVKPAASTRSGNE